MTPLLAALATALVLGGLLVAAIGVRGTVDQPAPTNRVLVTGRLAALSNRTAHLSRRTQILLATGLAAGLLVWLFTGWIIAVPILPLAAAGLPKLLSAPDGGTAIARLEAMEEWTRSLAGVLTVGVGLEQALVATLKSTPDPIRPEVATLVARIRSRWATDDALRAFADDLDDATGDLVAANLLLGAQRRGSGLASVLEGLAESVAADVRSRRAIEADRAKPRATARWITLITVVVLIGLALNGTYIAPYGSPLGQAVLVLMLGAYIGCLIWMRRLAAGTKMPRFIGSHLTTRRQP